MFFAAKQSVLPYLKNKSAPPVFAFKKRKRKRGSASSVCRCLIFVVSDGMKEFSVLVLDLWTSLKKQKTSCFLKNTVDIKGLNCLVMLPRDDLNR